MLENLSWEDETRLTFIELADSMNKNSNPLDSIIDFAWASGADRFWINNAKDELKRLREEVKKAQVKTKEWVEEVYRANEFAVEQTNEYLKAAEELGSIRGSIDKPVAYAKITENGVLYNLNIRNNPYDDQTKVVPLYMIVKNV